ncbi:hypothetical protein HPP92_007143 [Vanilla planifolia]|uniref:Uncharacterized protein n=1 Tax=Vanilla planifolia TaxID=51239 RepID=A0A835RDI9_VANPL|nr:hypothetical protein HPP92_007143 [Vanilla planifolia]
MTRLGAGLGALALDWAAFRRSNIEASWTASASLDRCLVETLNPLAFNLGPSLHIRFLGVSSKLAVKATHKI